MEYRKKPVTIEAWPVSDILRSASSDWKALPTSVQEAYEKGVFLFLPKSIEIRTLEGTMTAENSDMLIRGIKGEFYPCKPDIFAAIYDSL
jgi:hypothetical protein